MATTKNIQDNLDPDWCYYSGMPSPSAYMDQDDENTPLESTDLTSGELSIQNDGVDQLMKNNRLKTDFLR